VLVHDAGGWSPSATQAEAPGRCRDVPRTWRCLGGEDQCALRRSKVGVLKVIDLLAFLSHLIILHFPL